MERKFKKLGHIPGTLPSFRNAQLLVSSGIPSFDELIGNGMAVGTVSLIEEDVQGVYSKVMFKYFLAEGIVNKHSTLIASQEFDPKSIVQQLPALITSESQPPAETQPHGDDKMKIAFRYHNLPTSEKPIRHQFGHYYDLSKTMSSKTVDEVDLSYWNKVSVENAQKVFSNPVYHDLLETIRTKLRVGQFFVKDAPEKRSILRIGILGLASPVWFSEEYSVSSQVKDVNMFLFCLRALMRSAFAVAFVTIPTHLYDKGTFERCIHCSDVAVRLEAFAGTELEHNKYLGDYQGFFYLTKSAAINSFISPHPGSVEYAFKLRRRKFCIEMLHLPPDIQTSDGDKRSEIPTMGCGSSNRHLLEF